MSKSRFICPTVQSRAYGLEWLGVICTTEIPSRIFIIFFQKWIPTNTAQRVHTIFHNSLFLLFGCVVRSLLHLLHLTVVKILVQLTLLISKTGFGVWVLDWSVRHILFCTWITGLFHYHFINNGSCRAIGHLCLSKWPFFSNVKTHQHREIMDPFGICI